MNTIHQTQRINFALNDFIGYLEQVMNLDHLFCPICQHDEFSIKGNVHNGNLRFLSLTEAEIIKRKSQIEIVPISIGHMLLIMVCNNCNYIMTFDADPFIQWRNQQALAHRTSI